MITKKEDEILSKVLTTILSAPDNVTRTDFNDAYNCCYLHCSEKSDSYLIKGEDVYKKLEDALDRYSKKIEFIGSCDLFADQIITFRLSLDILTKIFSYLEKFFIKTSILNGSNVKKLEDLFYYNIYYNFIYKVEEGILNVVFLEVETVRNFYKHDVNNLKVVISFYLEALSRNGLETNIKQFYKRYIDGFKSTFDFNSNTRKLVRKIYTEVYISTNVFNEYEITKDIICFIMGRKDEILKYAFQKIEKFEKLKHIYLIINKMPESGRTEFKQRYESFLSALFTTSNGFESLYQSYCNVNKQVSTNKMVEVADMVDECIKRSLREKDSNEQVRVYDGIVDYVANNFCDSTIGFINSAGPNESNQSLNDKAAERTVLFNFFAALVDERLIDRYITSVQFRLINGGNPNVEYELMTMILERIGLGAISRLKNSISSFINKISFECKLNVPTHSFKVSLVKITKGFWNIEKNETTLHSTLNKIKDLVNDKSEIHEKQVIEFNYSISPVVFELNGTQYKVATDVFSIYYKILTSHEEVDKDVMKSNWSDINFDKNTAVLINSGLLACRTDDNGKIWYTAVNLIQKDTTKRNLFNLNGYEMSQKEVKPLIENRIYVTESKVCRLLKQKKFLQKSLIYDQIDTDPVEVENAIHSLAAKGYLDIAEDIVHYVP